jgi:ATP synthase protein I
VSEDRGPSGPGRVFQQVGPYLGIGVEFTASILICLGIGWWVDQRYHTSPWLTLVGAFFGMAAGFYNLYRTVVGMSKKGRDGPGRGETHG